MQNRLTKFQRILIVCGSVYVFVIWFGFFDLVLSDDQGESSFYNSIPLTCFTWAITIGIHSVYWKHTTKWSARTFYALMMLIIGSITYESVLLLVFEGPITERTRIEQGIEKSFAVAVELQQNNVETLTEQFCATEATIDIIEPPRVHVEQLMSKLQQMETELYNLQYVDKIEHSKTWKVNPKNGRLSLETTIQWITSGGCERYHTSENRESASEAQDLCKARLNSIKSKITELERRKAKLVEDIVGLREQIRLSTKDSDEARAKELSQAKIADRCALEVDKMNDWFTTELKGYGRKLLTTNTSIFTLSNCSDPNTKSTSIQTFKSNIAASLASRLEVDLTYLEDFYNDIIASKTGSDRKFYEDAYKAQRNAILALKDRKQEICEAWIFEYTTPHFFQKISTLDDIVSGKSYNWPERNYTDEDCQIMLNILKVPAPETGLCANKELQTPDTQQIKPVRVTEIPKSKRIYNIIIVTHFTLCFWGGLIPLLNRKRS